MLTDKRKIIALIVSFIKKLQKIVYTIVECQLVERCQALFNCFITGSFTCMFKHFSILNPAIFPNYKCPALAYTFHIHNKCFMQAVWNPEKLFLITGKSHSKKLPHFISKQFIFNFYTLPFFYYENTGRCCNSSDCKKI